MTVGLVDLREVLHAQHHAEAVFPGVGQCQLQDVELLERWQLINKEVMNTALKFAQARLSPPTFGQIAAEAGIDTPESYFREVKEEYVSRRDYVVSTLNSIEGVFCPKPSGAFYCIAKLPIDNADKFCQWLLEEFNFNKETVMLAPATGFYNGL